MIALRPISADDPVLDGSRLLDALYKTIAYANENGGIGLTPSKAFNRKFCHWAAENFNWPEYSADYLLRIQKVLNEPDVLPVLILHDLLWVMKAGRHIKGKFQFSKKFLTLAKDRGALFARLADTYLFNYNHTWTRRDSDIAPSFAWDEYLNVINVEAHNGTTDGDLMQIFFGLGQDDSHDRTFWDYYSFLTWEIVKPLCWIGFLDDNETGSDGLLEREIYTKTDLWRKCLRLGTDQVLKPRVLH